MRLIMMLFFCLSLSAQAEEQTFEDIMNSIEGQITARIADGVIHSIDLGERSAIIGGHKYWFGPAFSEIPLKVYLYGSEGGALELLQPGMKVNITYGDTGNARIAAIVRQLADDAEVDH